MMREKKINSKSGLSGLRGIFAVILFSFITVNYSIASGGEEMEGSQLEKFLAEESKKDDTIVDGFEDMEYAAFLETNVGYGVTQNYYRYGIYGDFAQTTEAGEKVYFKLCEKILEKEISMTKHEEWAENKIAHIQNLSSDLQWIVAREYPKTSLEAVYEDKVFHNGQLVVKEQGCLSKDDILFCFQRVGQNGYNLLNSELFMKRKAIVDEVWGYSYVALVNNVTGLDDYGKLLTVAESDNQTMRIYRLADMDLLYCIKVEHLDSDWPIEVSQIVGDENQGWIVFSNGDITYKMTYPDGNIEELGEYMYGTVYSPDGKYRAYCTGNIELYDLSLSISDEKYEKYCKMYEKWEKIPDGWYVEEMATGKKMYIPIETWEQDGRPIYGGRCMWIEKDELQKFLDV